MYTSILFSGINKKSSFPFIFWEIMMMRLLLVIVLCFSVFSFAGKAKAVVYLTPDFVDFMQRKELFIPISNSPKHSVKINKKSIDKYLVCRLDDGMSLSYRINKEVFIYENSVDVFCENGKPVIKRIYM